MHYKVITKKAIVSGEVGIQEKDEERETETQTESECEESSTFAFVKSS